MNSLTILRSEHRSLFVTFALAVVLCSASQGLAAPGDLDRLFGTGGIVRSTDFAGYATAIQSDGRIVAAGAFFPAGGGFSFALARYDTDGSPDMTFGTNGRVVTYIGNLGYSFASAVAIQSDGKIIAAGSNDFYGDGNYNFLLARYKADGSLDASFGSDGKVVTSFENEASLTDIAIQSDGKIVAVGASGGFYTSRDFLLTRYNTDGSLDISFGSGGIVADAFGVNSHATAMAIQSDDKIIAAGSNDSNGGNFLLARYKTDGSLDPTFGSDGRVVTPFNTQAYLSDIAIQTDGKIIAVGGETETTIFSFASARYDTHGSLDPTFGSGGKVITTFNGDGLAYATAIQSDGKIIAVGTSGGGVNNAFTLVRYKTDGSLDPSFGAGGIVITTFSDGYSLAFAAAIQSDGKIVVVGDIYPATGGFGRLAMVRYQGRQGTRNKPFDYDGDGRTDISVFRPSTGAWYLQRSTAGLYGILFGVSTDKITPADFDGDGKTDIAVYRPATGTWYVLNSRNVTVSSYQFGLAEDLPVPADYDGDGMADISVFRPSTSTWYRQNSSDGSFYAIQFGASGDKPTVGDFDGDGKADIAIFRPSVGAWYHINSSNGSLFGEQFGFGTDIIVPADYDGDGKTDLAVFRPSNDFWYIKRSATSTYTAYPFGLSADIPAPGDFDGDGKADLSVFRPSQGTWYRMNSSDGSFNAFQFGTNGDKPTQTAFLY